MIVEFIEGSLWTFSVIVFVIGVSYRIFSILRLGTKPDLNVARAGGSGGAIRTLFGRFLPKREFVKQAGGEHGPFATERVSDDADPMSVDLGA